MADKKLKACVDCAHCVGNWMCDASKYYPPMDVVTGQAGEPQRYSCRQARYYRDLCGDDATRFKPRPVTPRPWYAFWRAA